MSAPRPSLPFTGVVLAGGRSSRMGRDKAMILLPNGLTLLDQALQTLRAAGAGELLVSVHQGQTYARPGTRELVDAADNCGPLTGLVAALETASSDYIVALAVDLPAMPAAYLGRLMALSTPDCGAVPVQGAYFEPLAAVYPRRAARAARDAFVAGRYSLQSWVRELAAGGMIRPVTVEPGETGYFSNWNNPGDVATGYSP